MFIRTFVVACLILALSEAAFVDTITKCSIKDEECLRTSFGDNFRKIGESGISELSIPIFDPLKLENQIVTVIDLLNFHLKDAKLSGMKNCNTDKFAIDLDKGQGLNEFTCNLIILEGIYHFTSSSPVFKDVFGSDIHGDGNGKVEVEKLHIKLDFPVSVEKRQDEIYLKYDYNHVAYDYEILGKIKVFADSIYIGEKESSKDVLKFINDNWKLMVNSFSKEFAEKALKIGFGIASKFFNFVPAKYYLTDDLTSYVK